MNRHLQLEVSAGQRLREAKSKENRFMALLNGVNTLWKDAQFLQLVREEKLPDRPELAGEFHYES